MRRLWQRWRRRRALRILFPPRAGMESCIVGVYVPVSNLRSGDERIVNQIVHDISAAARRDTVQRMKFYANH